MELTLSEQDRKQLREHGLSETVLQQQLDRFERGVPFTELDRACVPDDGIRILSDEQRDSAVEAQQTAAAEGRFSKFVPASGAASRMFRSLLALHAGDTPLTEDALEQRTANGDADASFGLLFLKNLDRFAFFPRLADVLEDQGLDVDTLLHDGEYAPILHALLHESGLDYASKPKGLIPFHRAGNDVRTPVAEHLLEAIETVRDDENRARLHFTVSPEHRIAFENEVRVFAQRYPEIHFEVEFSEQSPSTDTVAADMNNQPFRDSEGQLLFRPGGHGALLKNLNELDADLVYIKNIDNVVPPRLAETNFVEKRVLGGLAVQLLHTRNEALRELERECPAPERVDELADFAASELELPLPGWEKRTLEQRRQYLLEALDRPFRVCGMVKNEGDPGGGPFWVKRRDGRIDRQIVETSQIDSSDPEQKAILESATHFNPVDLVCALRDHHGKPYELQRFVDPETAFISQKSKDGRDLKALELPGLWNGSMADWLTVFVQVPAETFTPVKTVNDLLKDEHQGEKDS